MRHLPSTDILKESIQDGRLKTLGHLAQVTTIMANQAAKKQSDHWDEKVLNAGKPINLTATWTTPDDLIRDDLHGIRIHHHGRLLRLSESEIDEIMAIIDKHKAQISHDVDNDEIITTPRMPKSRRNTTKD